MDEHDKPERVAFHASDHRDKTIKAFTKQNGAHEGERFLSFNLKGALSTLEQRKPVVKAASATKVKKKADLSRKDARMISTAKLQSFWDQSEVSKTSVAKLTVADALKECFDKRQSIHNDGPLSTVSKLYNEDQVGEDCMTDCARKAIQNIKSVKKRTDMILSSELLTNLIKEFWNKWSHQRFGTYSHCDF